jgi:Ca2+-binding EF-hand superfamily protein
MMMKTWMKGLAALGFGLVTMTGIARAQAPAAPPAGGNQPQEGIEIERKPGDLPGPIDSLHDLQDSARMAFMMADQNHDGLISQQEATDAGNMLVGGVFFAADGNGYGAVSQEEAQAAREKFLQQNPLLRFVLQRVKGPNDPNQIAGTEAVKNVGNLLDANNDQSLQATEVRQAVTSGVQGIFALADTNRDNQLSPTELNAAVYGLAQAATRAAFQAADGDKNGALSKEEFAKAIAEPAYTVFDILDANLDGQLATEELDRAGRVIASQIQMFTVPEAANSPERLIETGQRPREVAPVPNVPVNTRTRNPNQPPATRPQP